MSVSLMAEVWKLDLSTSEKMVLLALADWSNGDGVCWPSMTQLARKSSLTDRALRAIVGRLVGHGHLTRNENPGKGVSYVVHPKQVTDEATNPGSAFPPEARSPRKQTTDTPERASANTLVTTNPISEANASSIGRARATNRRPATPEGFDAFWAAYPRRIARKPAERAFGNAMARIADGDPLAVILAGIERAMPGWDDPRFIPHAATWLNADRWNDPPPNPRRPSDARPDPRHSARQANYEAAWAGADRALEVLAARRAF